MRCRTLVLVALSLLAASPAWAGPITYHVSVNTSSIAGTAGSLDFEFNPGPLASQSASLQILNFASNGSLAGAPQIFGDVTGGPLPTTLTFDNGGAFNDYFEGFTFGSALAFDVRLFGPALSAPNGTSTSGSAFGFSMFSDPGGTIAALTNDPTGVAVRIDVLLNGTSSVTTSSSVTAVSLPEPGTLWLMATGLIGCGCTRLRYLITPSNGGMLNDGTHDRGGAIRVFRVTW
jgi:PEP-CTERM motif